MTDRRWRDRHPVASFVLPVVVLLAALYVIAGSGVVQPRLDVDGSVVVVGESTYRVATVTNDGVVPVTLGGARDRYATTWSTLELGQPERCGSDGATHRLVRVEPGETVTVSWRRPDDETTSDEVALLVDAWAPLVSDRTVFGPASEAPVSGDAEVRTPCA